MGCSERLSVKWVRARRGRLALRFFHLCPLSAEIVCSPKEHPLPARGAPVKYLARTCLLTLFMAPCYSASAQTAPNPAPTKPRPQMAVWNQQATEFFGITPETFKSMGFAKLTQQEYGQVLSWATGRQLDAEAKGRDVGRSENPQVALPTYSCGPEKVDVNTLSKVRLFVDSNNQTPSELMSTLRQKLRNISDVEIVFDRKEADLILYLIGYENRLVGGTTVGYIAAMTVTSPCTWKMGTYNGTFEKHEDSFLQSGGKNPGELSESIAAKLDTSDIEPVRGENAGVKKYLQAPKK
jgi:hypothetical protein